MFEGFFQMAMRAASRLLFGAALLIFIWGVSFSIYELTQARGDQVFGFGGDRWGLADTLLAIFSTVFDPAAMLFFGAAIIYRFDLWVDELPRT